MCGIYGAVSLSGAPLPSREVLTAMGRAVAHRGPDDHSLLLSPHAAAGVERLRITDPRPQAAQPFRDPSERVWVSCNGAIYNADTLRARYADYPYCSRSDVEPIVPLYLERGPDGLAELDGMFAIAIWDALEGRLTLARDRAGEKPLFHATAGGAILYASEIQGLLAEPRVPRSVDPDAEVELLALGYAREPRTLFREVRTVPAGAIVTLDRSGRTERQYWHVQATPVRSVNPHDAVQHLDALLTEAVRRQCAADVPVGVFTSGGLDSALLAALAVESRGGERVPTFTVGFSPPSFDERGPAARLATALGTPHHAVVADDGALRAALDELTETVAEPITDPAVLPTMVLARAARAEVGVVLSGEGADELFLGYPTYIGHRLAEGYAAMPRTTQHMIGAAVRRLPTSDAKVPTEYLLKRFVAHATEDLPARHVSWFGTGLLPWLGYAARERLDLSFEPGPDAVSRAAQFDYRTYLREGLLPKIDRATMRVGLEARAPYLDPRVTEFAFGLPTALRLRGLRAKWILKQVARAHLPRFVAHRRKRGMSVPIAAWLRGPLQSEVLDLVESCPPVREGLLNRAVLTQLVSQHLEGRADHARALWALLIYARWRARWIGD